MNGMVTQETLWLEAYKAANRAILDEDPEFAAWLDRDYVPIAGAWQY
jgi:hypothetical protein